MTALQAQAMQMMESMPDQAILAIIRYMEKYNSQCLAKKNSNPFSDKEWKQFIYGSETQDKKKSNAFAAMETWKNENKNYFGIDFDYKRELLEAIDEKYGIVD